MHTISQTLLGDYNLPHITWLSSPLRVSQNSYVDPQHRESAEYIFNCYSTHNLEEYYPCHPDKGYSLDLLFAPSNLISPLEIQDELIPTDIHHISKFFEINEPSSQEFTPTAFSRNLLAANYDQIRHNLLDVNWDNLLVDDHVDHLVDKFYIKMQKVIDTHVRIVKQSPRSYPKWYDEELISLIQSKKRAYCDWKRIRTIDCFIEFKRIRAMCIRLSRSKYQDYMRSVESAVKRNIHSFWSYIKNNKKESGIPSNTFWNSTSANNDHETTNLFAAFFGSVYINNNIEEVSRLECTDEIFSDIQLSEESLQTIISGLDNNVNPGPDGIPSFFVKKCWSALKKPICF